MTSSNPQYLHPTRPSGAAEGRGNAFACHAYYASGDPAVPTVRVRRPPQTQKPQKPKALVCHFMACCREECSPCRAHGIPRSWRR